MKHAGPDALDQLEPVLDEIRRLDGLKEKRRGSFYLGKVWLLHFHEDLAGFFADLQDGDDFVRLPVNTKTQTRTLLRRVAGAVKSAKSGCLRAAE